LKPSFLPHVDTTPFDGICREKVCYSFPLLTQIESLKMQNVNCFNPKCIQQNGNVRFREGVVVQVGKVWKEEE